MNQHVSMELVSAVMATKNPGTRKSATISSSLMCHSSWILRTPYLIG